MFLACAQVYECTSTAFRGLDIGFALGHTNFTNYFARVLPGAFYNSTSGAGSDLLHGYLPSPDSEHPWHSVCLKLLHGPAAAHITLHFASA
jgi:hypothetical protein